MTFGTTWGWGADEAEVRHIVELFAEHGGNFIDTADFYTGGDSERLVGTAIRPARDRWVVATKYSLHRDSDDPNAQGNHRKNLVRAVEHSLARLGTDYVDLLWVHAWDFTLRVDDLLWALERMVSTGKVLHVGISDTPAWIVSSAQATARARGWQGFSAVQLEYSLKERTAERDLLPMAAAHGLAVTAWSPLGSGALTGKYAAGMPGGSRLAAGYPVELGDGTRRVAAAVSAVAARIGRSPAEVALAWLLSRSDPAIIPIVGARTVDQLRDNLGAAGLRLPADAHEELDLVSAAPLGFPHEFLAGPLARFALWGNCAERVMR